MAEKRMAEKRMVEKRMARIVWTTAGGACHGW